MALGRCVGTGGASFPPAPGQMERKGANPSVPLLLAPGAEVEGFDGRGLKWEEVWREAVGSL